MLFGGALWVRGGRCIYGGVESSGVVLLRNGRNRAKRKSPVVIRLFAKSDQEKRRYLNYIDVNVVNVPVVLRRFASFFRAKLSESSRI